MGPVYVPTVWKVVPIPPLKATYAIPKMVEWVLVFELHDC